MSAVFGKQNTLSSDTTINNLNHSWKKRKQLNNLQFTLHRIIYEDNNENNDLQLMQIISRRLNCSRIEVIISFYAARIVRSIRVVAYHQSSQSSHFVLSYFTSVPNHFDFPNLHTRDTKHSLIVKHIIIIKRLNNTKTFTIKRLHKTAYKLGSCLRKHWTSHTSHKP